MRTLLVTKIILLLIVINSDELEFLTKALILNDRQPFFIFLFHFSFSLTLSLTAHLQHPNIQTIPTPNQITFAASKRRSRRSHSRRSRRHNHRLPFPFRNDLAESFAVAVTFACCRRICLSSSLKLAVVTEAWSSSPIKPQRHFGSLLHRRISSLSPIQLPRPFDFHLHRLFAFPSLLQTPTTLRLPLQPVTLHLPFKLFFFLTTSSMRLLKLYLFIAFLQSAILHTHTYMNAYISLIVFICLNCCFCKRVRWVCVVFVCGQVLDGVLSYDDDNHFMRRNVYWFGDGEFY